MTHTITALCTRQGDCVEVCPVDCIIPGPKNDPEWGDRFYIDPDTCIDCGACVPVCPPEAIFPEEDVPEEYLSDIQRDAAFFIEGPGYWDFDLDEERDSSIRLPPPVAPPIPSPPQPIPLPLNLDFPQPVDVIHVDFSFGPIIQQEGLSQPYKVVTWDTIPNNLKDPEGYWTGIYYGVIAFQVNKKFVSTLPRDWPDLLKREYKNQIALADDQPLIDLISKGTGAQPLAPPSQQRELSQAFYAIYAAALGNGGSLDDVAPGVKFFKQLNEIGNFVPISGTRRTFEEGTTPILLRWDYHALADKAALAGAPDVEIIIPQSGILAGVYLLAINAQAVHPYAVRLWMEFLYSDEGQRILLEDYRHPIRYDDLIAQGSIPNELKTNLPTQEYYNQAMFPTATQLEVAINLIFDNWDQIPVGEMILPGPTDDTKYDKETHQWVRKEDDYFVCGLTDFAQHDLSDIVSVQITMKLIEQSASLHKGDVFGSIEGIKARRDLYMILSGRIIEFNERLADNPELINNDPTGEGWIIRLELNEDDPTAEDEWDDLFFEDDYKASLEVE